MSTEVNLLAGTIMRAGDITGKGLEDGALRTTKWGFMRAGDRLEFGGEDTHDTESSILLVPLLF